MSSVMTEPTSAGSETVPHLLVFFPLGTSPEEIEDGVKAVHGAAVKTVELVDSLAWYDSRFDACGGWDPWALEAVTGRRYGHRRDYFDGFIVTGEECVGQGTAKVVALALRVHKPVYWLAGTQLQSVVEVTSEDGIWRISTGEIS
jgi:hypothetical protein